MACSQCQCNSNPCRCSSQAFYNTADVCAEDNCLKIYQPQFQFAVCPTVSWNVPACGFTSLLSIQGLQGASVGAYIWERNFGYFEITSIDAEKGLLGITNHCTEGNAAPGTSVPGCLCFVVTVPPVDPVDSTIGLVCLEFDFTAPANGDCIDIIVSSTIGLASGDTVQIGTGFYLLDEVKPDNIITICNQGEGITPGTPVIAKDVNGNFLKCLSIISSNPCDRHIRTGLILACDGNDATNTLNECEIGYVPRVVDEDCNVELWPADQPLCTRLSSILTIVAATATYTLVVEDSSAFIVTETITIQGRSERYRITAIADATHIAVTSIPTPGANAVVPIGSFVCLVSCCESLLYCSPQETLFPIAPALYVEAVDLTPGAADSWETIPAMNANLITFTAPNICNIGAVWHLMARVNVTALLDYDLAEADGVPVISGEIQAYWTNQPTGGRFNWVDTMPDGVVAEGYPVDLFFPIWNILKIETGNFPITYHGAYVIAETILTQGQSASLILDAKLIQGDDNYPTAVRTLSVYALGELSVMRTL